MISAPEPKVRPDPIDEAIDVVAASIRDAVATALERAETCGCPGCRAQAVEAATWARDLLEAPPVRRRAV
jgi:hypothetical protein